MKIFAEMIWRIAMVKEKLDHKVLLKVQFWAEETPVTISHGSDDA